MTSILRSEGDGSTHAFSVPPYIERDHVIVQVDGFTMELGEQYEWLNPAEITFLITPPQGTKVVRRRKTPFEPMVNFEPGPLSDEDLDLSLRQCLYLAEEAWDLANYAEDLSGEALAFLGLMLAVDLAVSVPYPPAAGERCGEWRMHMPTTLAVSDHPLVGGQLWAPIADPVSVDLIRYVTATDTEETLGTFTVAASETDMVFTPASLYAQPLDPGDYIRLRMGVASSLLEGLSVSLRLRKRA